MMGTSVRLRCQSPASGSDLRERPLTPVVPGTLFSAMLASELFGSAADIISSDPAFVRRGHVELQLVYGRILQKNQIASYLPLPHPSR